MASKPYQKKINGKKQGNYYFTYRVGGKPYTENLNTDKLQAAKLKIAAKIIKGELNISKKIVMDDVLNAYERYHKNHHTKRHAKEQLSRVRGFVNYCRIVKLTDVTKEKVEEYVAVRRDGGLGDGGAWHEVKAIKTFLNWAKDNNKIAVIPKLKNGDQPEGELRFFSLAEIKKILLKSQASLDGQLFPRKLHAKKDVIKKLIKDIPDGVKNQLSKETLKGIWQEKFANEVSYPRFIAYVRHMRKGFPTQTGRKYGMLYYYIAIALYTGMRRCELWRLRWQDFNWGKCGVYVERKGKKKKRRDYIPFNPKLKAILKPIIKVDGMVSPTRNPVINVWPKLLESCGIHDANWHTLRHTFASHAVMNGKPLAAVSKLLGHFDIKTTMIYAHLCDKHLDDVGKSIDY